MAQTNNEAKVLQCGVQLDKIKASKPFKYMGFFVSDGGGLSIECVNMTSADMLIAREYFSTLISRQFADLPIVAAPGSGAPNGR